MSEVKKKSSWLGRLLTFVGIVAVVVTCAEFGLSKWVRWNGCKPFTGENWLRCMLYK